MFWKKKKKQEVKAEKHDYELTYENVAVPEVHTHAPEEAPASPQEKEDEEESVHYENLAIPEIHIRKKK